MHGRTAGRSRRVGAAIGAVFFLSIGPSVHPSAAQVGHDPARSPYVDMRRTHGIVFYSGWIGGDRGTLQIGHADGRTYTVGYEIPLGGTLSFYSSFTYAQTNRYVINPFRDDSVRLAGPFDDDMSIVDLGLRFNLTGNKTWHGIGLYASGAMGMAISMGTPQDSGSYTFKRKMTFTPGLGMRLFPTRRFSVVVDGRLTAWRLRYPPDYFRAVSSDGIPVLAEDAPEVEWTVHPWISFGLGWNF
jgi:hypothetical protein